MSLPQEPVFSMLKNDFVVGWKNIDREDYVGSSHGYTCEQAAVGTTNGAGPRNTQIFVLSPGGVVLHCLPGFWHPDDLAHELEFAKAMHRLWRDDRRSKPAKRKLFTRMQMTALRTQPAAMTARSGWQGFDAQNEKQRLEKGPRDTFYTDAQGRPGKIKPLNVLVHERMSQRPFLSLAKFDTEVFIDYGRPYYDNNARVDGTGVRFGTKGYMESQKRMAERRKQREAKKPPAKAEPDASTERYPSKAEGQQGKQGKWGEQRPTSRPTSRPSKKRARA